MFMPLFRGLEPAATRTMMHDVITLQRQLVASWAKGGETTLKAGFAAQHAVLAAGVSFIEAAIAARKPANEQLLDVVRQQQKALLGAWQTSAKIIEERLPTTPDAE